MKIKFKTDIKANPFEFLDVTSFYFIIYDKNKFAFAEDKTVVIEKDGKLNPMTQKDFFNIHKNINSIMRFELPMAKFVFYIAIEKCKSIKEIYEDIIALNKKDIDEYPYEEMIKNKGNKYFTNIMEEE